MWSLARELEVISEFGGVRVGNSTGTATLPNIHAWLRMYARNAGCKKGVTSIRWRCVLLWQRGFLLVSGARPGDDGRGGGVGSADSGRSPVRDPAAAQPRGGRAPEALRTPRTDPRPGRDIRKVPKLLSDPQLAGAVVERLEMGLSPHAIAADLRNKGRQPAKRVCAETIYQACL